MQKNAHHDLCQQQQHLVEELREDLGIGFTQVVEVYQTHLEHVASKVVGDTPRLAQQVEDIVQDGLLAAFERLKAHPEILSHRLKLLAWLCGLIEQQAHVYLNREEQHLVVTAGLRGEAQANDVERGECFPFHIPLLRFERSEQVRDAKHSDMVGAGSFPS